MLSKKVEDCIMSYNITENKEGWQKYRHNHIIDYNNIIDIVNDMKLNNNESDSRPYIYPLG
jgi:hypothetical protein